MGRSVRDVQGRLEWADADDDGKVSEGEWGDAVSGRAAAAGDGGGGGGGGACGAVDEPPCTPSPPPHEPPPPLPPLPSPRFQLQGDMLAGEELLIEGAWLGPGASSAGERPLMHDHGVTFPDEVRYGPAGRDFLDEHHMYPTLDARPSSARNRGRASTARIGCRLTPTARRATRPTRRRSSASPPPAGSPTPPTRSPPRAPPIAAPTAPSTTTSALLSPSTRRRPSGSPSLATPRRRRRAAPPTDPSSASPSSLSARAPLFFFDLEIDLYVGDAPRGGLDAERARDDDDERAASGRRSTSRRRPSAPPPPNGGARSDERRGRRRRRRRRRRRIGAVPRAGAGVAVPFRRRLDLLLRPDGGDGGAAHRRRQLGERAVPAALPGRAAAPRRPGRAPAGWLLYDGHVIAQSRPVAPRAHAWLPLTLRVSAAGLDATLDRAPLFEGVQLPNWRPADHWRLALIARSRSTVGDACWVDNLRVRSASLADAPTAPLSISLDAQHFTATEAPFAYHPPPVVSALLPPGGPDRRRRDRSRLRWRRRRRRRRHRPTSPVPLPLRSSGGAGHLGCVTHRRAMCLAVRAAGGARRPVPVRPLAQRSGLLRRCAAL